MSKLFCFAFLIGIAGLASQSHGAENTNKEVRFSTQQTFFKHKPGGSWRNTESFGTASCSGGGCESRFPVLIDGTRYNLTYTYAVSESPFDAVIKMEAVTSGTLNEIREFRVPISDLQSSTVELMRDKNGYGYYYTVTPIVIDSTEQSEPGLASKADLLGVLNFDSVVLLDDATYVGRLKMSGGPVAWFEIGGVAKLKISLLPFGNAEPIGVLEKGNLKITGPGGERVDITNVHVGHNSFDLPDGAYKIFVEWGESSEESVKAMIPVLQNIIKQKYGGNAASETRARLEKMESGKPLILTNGVGPASVAESAMP